MRGELLLKQTAPPPFSAPKEIPVVPPIEKMGKLKSGKEGPTDLEVEVKRGYRAFIGKHNRFLGFFLLPGGTWAPTTQAGRD